MSGKPFVCGLQVKDIEEGGQVRTRESARIRTMGAGIAACLVCGCLALAACSSAASTNAGSAGGTTAATTQASGTTTGESSALLSLSADEVSSLFSDSTSFKGQTITVTGKVIAEPDLGDNTHSFELMQDPMEKKNIVSVSYEADGLTVTGGDYLTVTGVVGDPVQKVTTDGNVFQIVTVAASDVKSASYKDAMHPTLMEKDVNLTVEQEDCSITVEKVEYAADETRVYIKATDNSKGQFDIHTYNAVLTQNGQEYDESFNKKSDYQQVTARLEAGDSTEGVLCFSAISQEGFDLSIPGELDNESFPDDFTFTIE